jgi:Putative lipoprotein LpqV
MRPHPCHAAAVVALVCLSAVGCSSGSDSTPATSSAPATTTTTVSTSETHTPAPGAVELSPGGVTTGVGAPAESTEDEYFQACHAAKVWMDQQGGDPKSQIESYLASLQSSDSTGPGTFGTPWSKLTPARQSAAIVAVQAAADALC